MNYRRVHDRIIKFAQERDSSHLGYTEKHHIVPRSMGGSDDRNNIVILTAQEHFVVHRLLAKIYPNTGMVTAIFMMAGAMNKMNKYHVTSRTYSKLREINALRPSKGMKGRKHKKTSKQMISVMQSINYTLGIALVDIHLRRWFNNGKTDLWLFDWDEVPNGFARGRLSNIPPSKKGAVWINNGEVEKLDQIDKLTDGWVKGRLKR